LSRRNSVILLTILLLTLALPLTARADGPGVVARYGAVAAASLVMTLPTLIVFVALQKYVMETMAYSGIKS